MTTKVEIPVPWNTWTRLGIVGILLGIIGMQQVWLNKANGRIDKLQDQNNAWVSKFIDKTVEQKKQELFDPKVEEVKNTADSIKTAITQP